MNDETEQRPAEATPTVRLSSIIPERAQQLTPGTIIGDRYRVVSVLGRGGMGEVYRADDLKLGQPVALKFVSRTTATARELYDEVRIGRQISHPNICRLYDIAEIGDQVFITMEYVDGEDLASLLRRVGRLPADKAVAVVRDVCSGLAAVHEKGVVHRDLKPANVMIDARGRARITDFGLAINSAGAAGARAAGTPAYMAPEQLAGEAVTLQSDIYAVGLIGYEIITGRRPIEASTTRELLARQRAFDIPRPSSLVRDADHALEAVVIRCLDPNPAHRPQSAEELLHELPGGSDPLAAAIAAGETPSPEMIAAAREIGTLKFSAAATLLAATLAGLAAAATLSSAAMLFRQVPLKPPEVLRERARELLALAGVRDPPRDSSYHYAVDRDRRGAADTNGPAPLLFVYRQSPEPMAPRNAQRRILQDDPSLTYPGMADVMLESTGRLMNLAVVPPQMEPPPNSTRATDFSAFLRYAGVDPATVTPVTPAWAAPVDSDEKYAWSGVIDGTEVRFEAAAYHGRPVWFATIPPWRRPIDATAPPAVVNRLAQGIQLFFVGAFPLTVLFLARSNLRKRQGDRRGAWRVAVAMFAATTLSRLVRSHHVGTVGDELELVAHILMEAIFLALLLWVSYIAIEPFARRWWPRMLISWSRLLEGRARDPIVGRDILIGATTGVAIVIVWQLTAILPSSAAPLQPVTTTLGELRHVFFFIFRSGAEGLARGLGLVAMLLLTRMLLRNGRAAIIVTALILGAGVLAEAAGPLAVRIAYSVIAVGLSFFILFRYGLLALMSAAATVVLLRAIPLTLDADVWYFGRSSLALGLVAAVAVCGFITSSGGKWPLPRLEPD